MTTIGTVLAQPGNVVLYTSNNLALGFERDASEYRLLADHFLSNTCGGTFYPASTVVTEGLEVPFGWIPTQAVDPMNPGAIQAFWDNGPIGMAGAERWLDQQPWGPQNGRFNQGFVSPPLIYWADNGNGTFTLTGAGAALGPKVPPH